MGRDEVRAGLSYLQAIATTMHFLRSVGADIWDAEGVGLPETCERLAAAEPASREGWQLLARVVRHVMVALEERQDPRALLLQELHTQVMVHADDAALARQTGAHDDDDNAEA